MFAVSGGVTKGARYGLAIVGFMLLAGCLNPQSVKPAVDMFSIYDGRPSTAVEREQALRDCFNYGNSLGISGPMAVGMQICMLQIGFRAPDGEPPGLSSSVLDPGGNCVADAYMPVCWAMKYGWPQDPPPRWVKQGADPYQLGNVWYDCYSRYVMVTPYSTFAADVDRCMAESHGYTVAHPYSPAAPWLPRKYWPDCTKPVAERNWLEKKWCPSSAMPAPAANTTGQ